MISSRFISLVSAVVLGAFGTGGSSESNDVEHIRLFFIQGFSYTDVGSGNSRADSAVSMNGGRFT